MLFGIAKMFQPLEKKHILSYMELMEVLCLYISRIFTVVSIKLLTFEKKSQRWHMFIISYD